MNSILSDRCFHDEKAAYQFVESRVWPDGPVCPHCGGIERISQMKGKSTRIGTYKCYQCRKPFTVKVGTIFESSHVPLRHWLQAMFLMCSSKKGISSNQLARTLGCTLKTAWFISHRIRKAMEDIGIIQLGGGGNIVEADETFIGTKPDYPKVRGGYYHKFALMSLVQRGGNVHSVKLDRITQKEVTKIIHANVAKDTKLVTDTGAHYRHAKLNVADHQLINHFAGEYVRGEAHTNTVENYFSVFQRCMKGTYQHCAEKHLHRYAAEFDFRYNHRQALGVNDETRTIRALKGIIGKRLTYETTQKRT
jgi:transposase-like protein